ncbi:hypothetical protein [Streptomyces sp. B22F1]|uniref:hypothetical protein n=1 Tax=Streptomyces sp. B22F1 TaxID=3153566 RepID=UPI00325DAB03
MRTRRAHRLAEQANATGNLRERHAWRMLTRAAEAGDPAAVDAVRTAWLRHPAGETWDLVREWVTFADLLTAATDPTRPAEQRAALGRFCAGQGFLPVGDVDRVLFYALTGQHAHHAALDPDGALLAVAYHGASKQTQQAVRDAMVGRGELNLVRALTDRPRRPLTAPEADYLTKQLADAREWAHLWRLIPTMPLANAARAAQLFTDWRPADDHARTFAGLLASVDPSALTTSNWPTTARIKRRLRENAIYFGDVQPYNTSFSPDSSELSIIHAKGITVYETHTGHTVADYLGRRLEKALALGEGMVVCKILRGDWVVGVPGRALAPLAPGEHVHGIRLSSTGFVATTPDHPRFASVDAEALLDAAERINWWGTVPIRELEIDQGTGIIDVADFDLLSGRLALRAYRKNSRGVLVLDGDLNPVAHWWDNYGAYGKADFYGPERVVRWTRYVGGATISTRRLTGDKYEQVACTKNARGSPVIVPTLEQLLIGMPDVSAPVWLDADTLTETDGPPGFPAMDAHTIHVEFSPGDGVVAIASPDDIRIHDLGLRRVAALLDQPLSEARREDLDFVATQAQRAVPGPVAAAVDVLHACLAYRFGSDIALGSRARIHLGAHDIALGNPGKDQP